MIHPRPDAEPTSADESPLGVGSDGVLRICLDLNVLMASALANIWQKPDGLRAKIVTDVAQNRGPVGGAQLIVSASMLTHLAVNLERTLDDWQRRKGTSKRTYTAQVDFVVDAFEAIVTGGPHREGPIVFSNSPHYLPSLDADPEDAHVLATAVHGGAHVLVTDDRHFVDPLRPMPARSAPLPNDPTVLLYRDGAHRLLMVPAKRYAEWCRFLPEQLPHFTPRPPEPLVRRVLFASGIWPDPKQADAGDAAGERATGTAAASDPSPGLVSAERIVSAAPAVPKRQSREGDQPSI